MLTVSAALLSNTPRGVSWLIGQLLFALAFLEWFFVMHEAGHRTLFRQRLPNMLVRVLGYRLRCIDYRTSNEVGWWQWLHTAKKLTGVEFVFGRRDESGFTY